MSDRLRLSSGGAPTSVGTLVGHAPPACATCAARRRRRRAAPRRHTARVCDVYVCGDVCHRRRGRLSSAQGRRGISPVLANGGVSPGLAKVAMGVQWVAHEGV